MFVEVKKDEDKQNYEAARLEEAYAKGELRGIQLTKRAFKLLGKGLSVSEIAEECEITESKVREILE